MDQATAAALAADPEGQRLLAEEQRLLAELAALEEPVGADAAGAAGTAPGGRPGLRVELPFDPFEQDRAAQQAQQAQRGVAAQQQGTPPSAPASPPASPLGYLQHQQREHAGHQHPGTGCGRRVWTRGGHTVGRADSWALACMEGGSLCRMFGGAANFNPPGE
jgi:hypothetical protein